MNARVPVRFRVGVRVKVKVRVPLRFRVGVRLKVRRYQPCRTCTLKYVPARIRKKKAPR